MSGMLGEAQAAAVDVAVGEVASDECIDVDAAGEDVAPGSAESRAAW
jgi:hypothetical protein